MPKTKPENDFANPVTLGAKAHWMRVMNQSKLADSTFRRVPWYAKKFCYDVAEAIVTDVRVREAIKRA